MLDMNDLRLMYPVCIRSSCPGDELRQDAAVSDSVSVRAVKHPRYRFKVSYRETLPDGTHLRRFRYFNKKAEADSFAQEKKIEIRNHGSRHSSIEEDERAALIRYRLWAANRDDAPSLSRLVEKAIEVFENDRPPLKVSEAIDARLEIATRRGLSRRHIADLESRLNRFRKDFGNLQLADIKAAAVESWLHRLKVGAETWRNYAKTIGSVFSLAVKRGFLAASPLSAVDRPKISRNAPEILTPEELSALLSSASSKLVPLLVLQAFCGLRRAEAERLTWGHIHFEADPPYVELPSSVTKTNRRRICELPISAIAWLKPLAGEPSGHLGLSETVYRDRLHAAARMAKIKWKNNVLRHSFGTYRLAATRNAALVAEEMGNSPAVVRTHYTNIASPAQAAAWWRIVPSRNDESNARDFSPHTPPS